MTSQNLIDEFLCLDKIAVVGASRDRHKFGNIILRRLKGSGKRVYAVNPEATSVEGEPSYPNLRALPEKVRAAILIIPPAQTERVINDAISAGVEYLWFQPGSESTRAVNLALKKGLKTIWDHCILKEMKKQARPPV